jgi:predicted ABC-type ATPase
MKKEHKPILYVIAGPNGAGKTTFIKKFLPEYAGCINFVNADLIAAGLSPFAPEAAAIKAGRIMLEQIRTYARKGSDFAFETTLSGMTYAKLFKQMKDSGYEIHLIFLWLRDVELALKRVAERVKSGGHDVPEDVVRRRFKRGIENLFTIYRPLIDRWILYDNSFGSPVLIAKETKGNMEVADSEIFGLLTKGLKNL